MRTVDKNNLGHTLAGLLAGEEALGEPIGIVDATGRVISVVIPASTYAGLTHDGAPGNERGGPAEGEQAPSTQLVHVDRGTLVRLLRHAGTRSPEAGVAIAVAEYLDRQGGADIQALFGTLSAEDWGDWDPAVGMNRSDPEYEETRRRKFGDDTELGSDE